MNYWTEISIEFANRRNYLDELYKVYPITPNLKRELPSGNVKAIIDGFERKDNKALISELLKLDLFPVKDSYVPYLRRDKTAIERNPNTVNRIAGNLYSMGLESILDKCSEPKETNRQMGPMFKNWLKKGVLGCSVYEKEEDFLNSADNGIFVASDVKMKNFAVKHLGYRRYDKGLDFIGKFNNKYIVGEAKLITDFGGHQNDQFVDAITTISSEFEKTDRTVIPVAITDGVLYIKGKHKLYKYLNANENHIILSALVLREYLYSL